jgi:hypothetical protein
MKTIDLEPQGSHTTQAVSLQHILPENRKNKYFYKNGLSELLPTLTLKVHTDVEECYELWNRFSPKKTLFDLWDYRYAWYLGTGYKLHFYTIYEGDRPLGTLPLWFNQKEKKYEWFGGYWVEGQYFFVEDEKFIDVLLAVIPNPVQLTSIEQFEGMDKLQIFGTLQKEKDPKFVKNISGLDSIDQYLSQLKKKERHHLKSDYYRIMSHNPRIEEHEGRELSHFEQMRDLNMSRFTGGVRETSVYASEKDTESFRHIVRNSGVYKLKYLKTFVQNKLAAVDMIITYGDYYYQFSGANDVARFSGIGNFMVYRELEDAIRGKFKVVDCLQEDHTWKHQFFDQRDMYVFEK